jgi:hypothetical protein
MGSLHKLAAQIKIESASSDDRDAYLRFASRNYGPSSYQASPRYISWLYDHGPYSRGFGQDLILARDRKGEVRGCIHKLRLPWRSEIREVFVPALHNMLLEPAYRGIAGGMLILQALRSESHAFVPGTNGIVAQTLPRLGFRVIPSTVYRKLLRPAAAYGAFLAWRLGLTPSSVQVPSLPSLRAAGVVSIDSAQDLAGLVKLANSGSRFAFSPAWTVKGMHWRFFHPHGPWSALWIEGPLKSPNAFAIVSIGRVKGVVLARVLCSAARDTRSHCRVLSQAALGSRALGVQVIQLTYVGAKSPGLPGWLRVARPPQSLIYKRTLAVEENWFCAGAGDYGLEALLTNR